MTKTTKSVQASTAQSTSTARKSASKKKILPVAPIAVNKAPEGVPTSPLNVTPTPSGTVSTPSAVTVTTPTPATTTSVTPSTSVPINVTTPPNVSIPAVPQGFVPPAKRAFFGYYVTQAELEAAPLVLTDLGNFTDYSVVLGAAAPPVSTVVGTLTAALQWRAMRAATDAWQAYVTAQDAIAWKAALTVLDEVKTLFEIAQKRTAALPTQYVGLAQMFDAGKVTAAEAQATRKKNAKDKATAAKNAAAATSATGNAGTLPATTAASSGTATAVPVAPKSTTVTTF